MKVYGVIDWRSDWYPKNAMLALRKHTTLQFVDTPDDADLIWIFSYYKSLDAILAKWAAAVYGFASPVMRLHASIAGSAVGERLIRGVARRKRSLVRKPVLASFHHLDPEKRSQYLPTLKLIDALADHVHFFSQINIDENRGYFSKPILLLPYWIDLECFFPRPDVQRRGSREAFGLPAEQVLIGSFQRDTEADRVSPKLVKGPDIFCDILDRLDPARYCAVLAGPRRDYVENRLARRGMPFFSLGHVPHERMGELYSCLDYYLVTSRCEGGPQAILEAMATKVRIFSTRVGVSDLLSDKVVITGDVVANFVEALKAPYPDVLDEHLARVRHYDGAAVARLYEQTFQSLLDDFHRAR